MQFTHERYVKNHCILKRELYNNSIRGSGWLSKMIQKTRKMRDFIVFVSWISYSLRQRELKSSLFFGPFLQSLIKAKKSFAVTYYTRLKLPKIVHLFRVLSNIFFIKLSKYFFKVIKIILEDVLTFLIFLLTGFQSMYVHWKYVLA